MTSPPSPSLQSDLSDPASTGQRIGRIPLLGWWSLMFIATHVPLPPSTGEAVVPDKWIHFGLYAVLGLLVPLWSGWRTVLTPRTAGAWFVVFAVYALMDELLQIPVGRTAEWMDGFADLLGAACGLAGAMCLQAVVLRWRVAPPHRSALGLPAATGD